MAKSKKVVSKKVVAAAEAPVVVALVPVAADVAGEAPPRLLPLLPPSLYRHGRKRQSGP